MDNSCRNDLEFLDYSNLDSCGRNELVSILRSNIDRNRLKLPWDKSDIIYRSRTTSLQPDSPAPKIWQHYETCPPMEIGGSILKYETQTNASSVLVGVPQTLSYGQPIMQTLYPEWSYNLPNDPNIHATYMQSVPYNSSQSIYPPTTETQDLGGLRDPCRKSRRISKTYNHNVNHSNEMHAGYISEHSQFPLTIPYHQTVFCLPDTSMSSQQHPSSVQQIFYPQVYHPASLPQQQPSHRIEYQRYRQSPTSMKYNRQTQISPSHANGDDICLKNISQNSQKIYNESRMQNSHAMKPSIHHTVDDENKSSQTNIVTTVIVNNSNVDTNAHGNDESLMSTNNSCSANKTYDFKIEQHIVSKINSEGLYKGNEKSEIPCVNIKSSIEVKQNGSDSKDDNDSVHPKESFNNNDTSQIVESNERSRDKQDIDSISEITVNHHKVSESSTNAVPIVSAASTTWAGILKKNNLESVRKPTAFIAPHNIANSSGSNYGANDKTVPPQKTNQNRYSAVPDGAKSRGDTSVDVKSGVDEKSYCQDPNIYRMGEFLLTYRTEKQTMSLSPRGLTNRSSYCYINSILQALLACPPFYNLLMAMPYTENPSKNSPCPLINSMQRFVREFSPITDNARLAKKDRCHKKNGETLLDMHYDAPFEPSYVYKILKDTSSATVFSEEGRQEDAEEFLSCLLNGISDEMLELMKLASINDRKYEIRTETIENKGPQDDDEWRIMGPKKGSITRCADFGRTPLSDIFRGQLRSRVSRAQEESTDYVQPFFTLQLDVKKAESVKGALDILVGKDALEGMTCSITNQEIEAWKQLTLEELPIVLILHLKWFDYKPDGCSKIVKTVYFPIDLKIDHKLLSNNTKNKLNAKQRQYKLFGVTYHDGKEATKGHYVTDAFHVGYGGWIRYDDSLLKAISEETVLNPQPPRVPYLLYYRRCDTIGNSQFNNFKLR